MTRGLVLASALAVALAAPQAALAAGPGAYDEIAIGVSPGREQAVRSALASKGLKVRARGAKGRYLVAEAASPEAAARVAEALGSAPGVDFAEPARKVHALATPSDSNFRQQWNMMWTGLPTAWNTTVGDPSVTVAVIDTGIDYDHPDLIGQIDESNAYDYVRSTPTVPDHTADDEHGHGTHVAGIIGANHGTGYVAGIAPGARIMPLKVLDGQGTGSDTDVALALDRAVSRGADIINLSLGDTVVSSVIKTAVDNARSQGVLVVAASGNYGDSRPFYPAALPNVIGVSATNSSDMRAGFSTYGPTVDFSAPGVDVLSTWPLTKTPLNYPPIVWMDGTSMAAPHVSGALALLKSLHPDWSDTQLAAALADSALDLGSPGRDDHFGLGRIRVASALSHSGDDDSLPGLTLVNSPVRGEVTPVADEGDAFQVFVPRGARLTATLTSAENTAPTLAVLDPAGVVLSSVSSGEQLMFTQPASADASCTLRVTQGGAAASYTLDWSVRTTSSATIKAPSTVSWGGSALISGTVKRQSGTPVYGKDTVAVYARPYGSSWKRIDTVDTDALGRYSRTVKPALRTEYKVSFITDAASLGSSSSVVTVTPKAYLTAPTAPSKIAYGRTFTSSGYLKPRHTAGQKSVIVSAYRLEGGSWKLRRTYSATNANYSSYTKYVAKLKLPYRGKWRLVARISGDYKHATTVSSSRYLTVY